jgi:hypothetical protein
LLLLMIVQDCYAPWFPVSFHSSSTHCDPFFCLLRRYCCVYCSVNAAACIAAAVTAAPLLLSTASLTAPAELQANRLAFLMLLLDVDETRPATVGPAVAK